MLCALLPLFALAVEAKAVAVVKKLGVDIEVGDREFPGAAADVRYRARWKGTSSITVVAHQHAPGKSHLLFDGHV